MSKTKFIIYFLVSIALVLGFTLIPVITASAAFNTYAGYTFSKDNTGSATWDSTVKRSGAYSVILSAPVSDDTGANQDFTRVKIPIASTPFSGFAAPSFYYKIHNDAVISNVALDLDATYPMYVRSGVTMDQGYLSPYPIIEIYDGANTHYIVGQPWAESTKVDWTLWSNAQASIPNTEAYWHDEAFTGGWQTLAALKATYSGYNVVSVRIGLGSFSENFDNQKAYVDDLTGSTYDLTPIAIENSCYQTGNTVNVRVLNGNAAGVVAAYAYSNTTGEGGKITLGLSETGTGTGVFAGSFQLITTTPAPGQLLINPNGDTLYVRYYDGDWGTGATQTVTATAIVDNGAPTIVLGTVLGTPTNASPIPVTVEFSETVYGFTADDIVTANGTVGTFVAVDGDSYTFNVTPTVDGLVTVNVAAGVAQDCAGNNNTAATQLTRTYDSLRPSVTINPTTPPIADPTNLTPLPLTAQFSEALKTGDFLVGDIDVTNGTAGNFVPVDGDTYTFDVTPTADGAVTVNIAENKAQDLASNNNTAATAFTRTYDGTDPTVTVNQAGGQVDPTTDAPINFTVVFSENVNDFITGDVTFAGTAPGTLVGTVTGGPITFNVAVTGMTDDGTVIATIAADKANDTAGNGNATSTSADNTVTYDQINPTCVLTSNPVGPNINTPPVITATFSSPVTGFTLDGDLTYTNALPSNLNPAAGPAAVYTFTLTPQAQGVVNIKVNAGAALDGATRPNLDSNVLNFNYDTVAPTIVISAPSTVGVPWQYTATFSENVGNFVFGDIVETNADNVGALGGASPGAVYTFNVNPNPATNGTVVTINIPAASVTDAAGNALAADGNYVRVYNGANAIYLSTGWNLVSYPLVPADNTIGTVLAGISANVNAVWYYDPATGWKSWSPAPAADTLTTFDDGNAYWVDMAAPGTLIVTGTVQPVPQPGQPAMPLAYDVVVGWNMVGYTSDTNPVAGRTTTNYWGAAFENNVQRMYRFDNAANSFAAVAKGAVLNPGEGLWLATTAAGTIYP